MIPMIRFITCCDDLSDYFMPCNAVPRVGEKVILVAGERQRCFMVNSVTWFFSSDKKCEVEVLVFELPEQE